MGDNDRGQVMKHTEPCEGGQWFIHIGRLRSYKICTLCAKEESDHAIKHTEPCKAGPNAWFRGSWNAVATDICSVCGEPHAQSEPAEDDDDLLEWVKINGIKYLVQQEVAARIAELEAELAGANRESEVRGERELRALARAQTAEEQLKSLKWAG